MNPQFGDLIATELYCPKCRRAQPVREKLLLVLPSGDLLEYLCVGCAASLAQKVVSGRGSASPLPNPAPTRLPRRRRG